MECFEKIIQAKYVLETRSFRIMNGRVSFCIKIEMICKFVYFIPIKRYQF